jgi:hypothetical protein
VQNCASLMSLHSKISRDSIAEGRSVIDGCVYENGRRYHAYRAGSYRLPCDLPELKRFVNPTPVSLWDVANGTDSMELHHHIFLLSLGGELHFAPIKDPKQILDIGTGAGEWAIEMAE